MSPALFAARTLGVEEGVPSSTRKIPRGSALFDSHDRKVPMNTAVAVGRAALSDRMVFAFAWAPR
ncbi:hypothetical protein NORO109296_19045 [Nocardiopsis rhodophaea]